MNLLLDRHNRLKIGDLGVSKLLTGIVPVTPKPGQRVGTPLYLAPEIVKHQSYEFKVRRLVTFSRLIHGQLDVCFIS